MKHSKRHAPSSMCPQPIMKISGWPPLWGIVEKSSSRSLTVS